MYFLKILYSEIFIQYLKKEKQKNYIKLLSTYQSVIEQSITRLKKENRMFKKIIIFSKTIIMSWLTKLRIN